MMRSVLRSTAAKASPASSVTTTTTTTRGLATTITAVKALEVLDSRGNPTVKAYVKTSSGKVFSACVPSGASTGIHEAVELRDGGKRYVGKGVQKAVDNVVKHLGPALVAAKVDVTDQRGVDKVMLDLDGTPNLGKMGANAILGVSLATARAGADARGVPLYEHIAWIAGKKDTSKFTLPVQSLNVINGGCHAANGLAVQEFMILPTGFSSFKEGLRAGTEVFHLLKADLKSKKMNTAVGDEGGFAPEVDTIEETLELLLRAIGKAGYDGKIQLGLDVASSEWWDAKEGKYNKNFKGDKPEWLTKEQMVQLWTGLASKYPIVSIEDPFDQDDFESYSRLTPQIGKKVQIVGDDLLCTNVKRVKMASDRNACNALLCKPNQIGYLSGTIDAVLQCQKNQWGVMMSHRSGETEDAIIADLSVGLGCGSIKTGAPCRSERLAKYNRLLEIEEELGSRAVYSGAKFRLP